MAIVKKEVKYKVYSVLKEVGTNDKCPPQAQVILAAIKARGGSVKREDLVADLKKPIESGGLKTNQTAERILGFYKPKLIEMGVLKEETKTETIDVEVPDKPAKAEAPAKTDAAAPAKAEKASKGSKGEAKGA